MSQPAFAQTRTAPVGALAFNEEDLDFVLKQIKIAERHVAGEELADILPNSTIPWGLRTVTGEFNNVIEGQTGFGQADLVFPVEVDRLFIAGQTMTADDMDVAAGSDTNYVSGVSVQDARPRLISHLIVNQSSDNPAAADAAGAEDGYLLGADITGTPQFLIPNTAPDEGLSAPFNAFMTFFGQFFDHGLDLVNKGGNGVVYMPIPADDPLFDSTPGASNFMVMPRASRQPGPDGVVGTDDDQFINATTPHVDQQQTYGSHASSQIILRHYDFTPLGCNDAAGFVNSAPGVCYLQNTGRMIDDYGLDKILDTADDGGMATWDAAQAQAEEKFGIILDDLDGANVPMFAADLYGRFEPGPARGLPQLVVANLDANGDPDGSFRLVEGDLAAPVDASLAVRVNHSFFLDVAHSSAPCGGCLPDDDLVVNARTDFLADQVTRGIRASAIEGFYDDELLGQHRICGDGRCNENIALTTIHTIFHREHNRLTDVIKRVVLDTGKCATLNEWLDTAVDCPADLTAAQDALTAAQVAQAALNPATAPPADLAAAAQAVANAQAAVDAISIRDLTLIDKNTGAAVAFAVSDASLSNQEAIHAAIGDLNLDWNGERIFQAARFGTEMQYNRVVFDEFAPTLAGLKDPFEGFHSNIDPAITAEYAQSVYRFGHSMLTETVDRYDPDFNRLTDAGALNPIGADAQLGLFEAFLNPCAWQNSDADCVATISPEQATGSVVRGLVRTTGNEIDEFITGAMQNNLVGLPLDIGAINIARGRDVGNPSLNAARKKFFAATGDARLTPYAHWVDYADNLRHASSLVNFIAAYGTHPNVAGPDGMAGSNDAGEPSTYSARRAAACGIVSVLNPTFCVDVGFVDAGDPIMVPTDAMDFLFSRNAWANTIDPADGSFANITGVDDIDFWNGGLAEERMPFGGYLGSTHNFVFENQLENLQNGDRFYYVGRTANINFLSQLESNSFTAIVMRNSDLGEPGAGVMSLNLFSIPNHVLEVDQSQQFSSEQADLAADAAQAVILAEAALAEAQAAMAAGGVADPAKVAEAAVAQATASAASVQASAAQTIAQMEAVDLLVAQNELARVQALGSPMVLLEAVSDGGGDYEIRIENFTIVGTLSSVPASVAGTCNFNTGTGQLRCGGTIANNTPIMLLDSGGNAATPAQVAAAGTAVNAAQTDLDTANANAAAAAEALVRANVLLVVANAAAVPVVPADVTSAEQALAAAQADAAAMSGGSTTDPAREEPLFDLVIRDAALVTTNITIPDPSRVVQYTGGDHVTIGGTEGDDTIIGGIGDDSLYGRGGNDRIEGGDGADLIEGGTGDDIITDLSGPDVIEGGAGNDAIHSGNEEDVIFGDEGNDFIVNSSEFGEIFAGEGDDYILDGTFLGHTRGGAGDDWIENLGGGEDLFQGDHGTAAEAGEPPHKGNDVGIGWAGNNDFDMENGDDIIVDGPGIERAEGQLGFDWISFAHDKFGVNIDLDLTIFLRPQLPPSNNTIANRYDRVEAASGSSFGDILRGTGNLPGADRGNELANFALITGLDGLVPDDERTDCLPDIVTGEAPEAGAQCWSGGDILLGGDGSDLLIGESGNDIIDGDSALAVGISTPDPAVRAGTEGVAAMLARSTAAAAASQAASDEAAAIAADAANTAAAAAETTALAASNAAIAAAAGPVATALADQTAASVAASAATASADTAVATEVGGAAAAAEAAASAAQATADTSAADALAATNAAAAAQTAADAAQAAATAAITAMADAGLIASLSADAVSSTTASFMADLAAFSATTMAQADAGAAAMAATAAESARATAIAGDPAAVAAASNSDAAAATAASSQAAADAAEADAGAALAAFMAADAAANDAVAARDAARAAADASAGLIGPAQAALAAAEDALEAAETTVVVQRMSDVMGAIFAGMINPGELSISRVISDQDAANTDTDAAYFTGPLEDYSIEGDPAAVAAVPATGDPAELFSDFNVDGFLQVLDNRGLPAGGDDRDLLRGIERLVFSDQTVVIDPRRLLSAAGLAVPFGSAAATHNRVATGAATRDARGPNDAGFGDRSPELGGTVRASAGAVRDADNTTTAGTIASLVDWVWESELEPGSGMFEPIERLTGINGNGDPIQIRGSEMTVTANEVGLQLRATGIFQDEADVFEIIRTPAVRVLVPEGFVFPDGLLPPVANAVAGSCSRLQALPIVAENVSRAGRPRIDFTIVEADLADFTGALPTFERTVPNVNDPNDLQIDPAAELAVGNIFARFVDDGTGEVTAVVAPEIVAVLEDILVPSLGTKNGNVDISWSIRGDDVAPLVNGLATATFALDQGGGQECVLGTVNLTGMSGVGDATNVAFTLVNGQVFDPEAGLPRAQFLGAPADIVALQGGGFFENASRPGLPRLDVIVPNVDLGLFVETGFSVPVAAEDEILTDTFTLTFRDSSPASVITGTFSGEIAAISDPITGVVSQTLVNLIFSIRGDDVAGLVDGVGTVTLSAGLIEVAAFDLFGNSTLDPEAVTELVSEGQRVAAAALDTALENLAATDSQVNRDAVDSAALAFEDANTAALVAVTEAELAAELAALPTATFLGGPGNLPVARTTFLNESGPDLPRLDIRVADLNTALFDIPNEFFLGGCPTAICPEDEIAVQGISLTFSTNLGATVTGIFAGEIVARVDPVSLVVDQLAVDLLFSIRGDLIVGPLVPAGAPTTITLGVTDAATGVTTAASSILVTGDSALDPEGVAAVEPGAFGAALLALNVANLVGDPIGIALAQGNLTRQMALAPAVFDGPVARALAIDAVTGPISSTPATPAPQPTDPAAPDAGTAHPQFPATGTVDARGRLRLQGNCDPGGQAWAPPLNCRSHKDGSFDCRGRALMPGTEISVSCSGGEPAIANLVIGAVGKADKRGQLRINGICETGTAWSPKLQCNTRRAGTFRCTSNGTSNPEEEAIVYCR